MIKNIFYATGFAFTIGLYSIIRIKEVRSESITKENLFSFETSGKEKKYYPIVYNENYNIWFYGLEKLLSFDVQRFGRIHQFIQDELKDKEFQSISPKREINTQEMSLVHTPEFIDQFHNSPRMVSDVADIPLLRYFPKSVINNKIMTPLKWQTSGDILASYVAMKHGTSFNIGGGYHHATAKYAEHSCLISDISLIIKYMWKNFDENLKFLIVDLDAHQGNGYARDKSELQANEQANIYIFDMYNKDLPPNDEFAKGLINRKIEVTSDVDDETYLQAVTSNLEDILKNSFKANLIIYNAGTDTIDGDPLGLMKLKPATIIKRDELVYEIAKKYNTPIVMLTSGGWQRSKQKTIADSVLNLIDKNLIKKIDIEMGSKV